MSRSNWVMAKKFTDRGKMEIDFLDNKGVYAYVWKRTRLTATWVAMYLHNMPFSSIYL